jgi:hypothetical protein
MFHVRRESCWRHFDESPPALHLIPPPKLHKKVPICVPPSNKINSSFPHSTTFSTADPFETLNSSCFTQTHRHHLFLSSQTHTKCFKATETRRSGERGKKTLFRVRSCIKASTYISVFPLGFEKKRSKSPVLMCYRE